MNRLAGLPKHSDVAALRIGSRLGMTFFLDYLRIAGDDHDLVDGLILVTVGQANVEHLDREPNPWDRHGDMDDPPPENSLRPITVSAVAATLRIPFETVRRRLARLQSVGACEIAKRGVTLPSATWSSERFRFRAYAVHQQARNLYLGLRDLGLLRPIPASETPRRMPLLALERLSAGYALRQLYSLSALAQDPIVPQRVV